MDLSNIVANSNKAAGFAGTLYVIKKADIDTWPTYAAGTYLTDTAFVPVIGKGFVEVPVSKIEGKATYVQENQGDADNPSKKGVLNAFHAGSDATTSHDLTAFDGAECICLWREKSNCDDAGNPIYQIIGTQCDGITLRVRYENNAPAKGYYIEGEEEGAGLPRFYNQTIPV